MTEAHESDATARMTFLAEKKRKRAPRDPLPAIPDGPCCFRCRNWHPPGKQDDFGRCRVAVVVREREPGGPEKGTLMPHKEATERMLMGWDFMSVRGFAPACSQYRSKE